MPTSSLTLSAALYRVSSMARSRIVKNISSVGTPRSAGSGSREFHISERIGRYDFLFLQKLKELPK
jgi:hypothetical protein